jgi:hypothetical protein
MEKERKIIDSLFNEWFHSKSLIIEFDKLFSKENLLIEIRRKFLEDFYFTIGELFWNYFLINMAKLLDPSSQRNFKNLSLFILVEILKNKNQITKSEELEQRLIILKEKNKNIINYRRKNLAHLDLNFSIGLEEFNSSTSIEELYSFYEEVLDIINYTLKELSLPIKSDIIINHGKHKGANELNKILIAYNSDYLSN